MHINIYIYDNFVGSCFVESKYVLGTWYLVRYYDINQVLIWHQFDQVRYQFGSLQLMLIMRAMVQHISISTNNIK